MNIHRLAITSLVSFAALAAFGQSLESLPRRAFGGIQPSLSADGQAIGMSFQGAICRIPSDGGVLTRLTRGEGWDVEPAWSPDGNRIAFINAPAFNSGRLRLIAAEDGSQVQLPKNVLAQ